MPLHLNCCRSLWLDRCNDETAGVIMVLSRRKLTFTLKLVGMFADFWYWHGRGPGTIRSKIILPLVVSAGDSLRCVWSVTSCLLKCSGHSSTATSE
ncbi:hypothetical protein A0H81_02502 [Grifola frondosa]|uniref:Uncharacterized protein n=1 Tax=Grifola frondosa TaxID=5627 RepID=A0A1C7MNU6_GRIFR|nr:hypothetical protein A0H81_02502 [Grifola frondosa]